MKYIFKNIYEKHSSLSESNIFSTEHSMEVISAEGFRQDGRTPTCLRSISCRLGLYDRPNGSAYIEMGNTKVLAAVYGPREVGFDFVN